MSEYTLIHLSKPEEVYPVDYEKYVYWICKCPLDTSMGHRVLKSNLTRKELETRYVNFECIECGTSGQSYIGGDNDSQ